MRQKLPDVLGALLMVLAWSLMFGVPVLISEWAKMNPSKAQWCIESGHYSAYWRYPVNETHRWYIKQSIEDAVQHGCYKR